VLNGRYLARQGYGAFAEDLADPKAVLEFVARLDRYEEALRGYAQDGNRELLTAVDGFLDRAAAGLL
jgi:hypothetical protein